MKRIVGSGIRRELECLQNGQARNGIALLGHGLAPWRAIHLDQLLVALGCAGFAVAALCYPIVVRQLDPEILRLALLGVLCFGVSAGLLTRSAVRDARRQWGTGGRASARSDAAGCCRKEAAASIEVRPDTAWRDRTLALALVPLALGLLLAALPTHWLGDLLAPAAYWVGAAVTMVIAVWLLVLSLIKLRRWLFGRSARLHLTSDGLEGLLAGHVIFPGPAPAHGAWSVHLVCVQRLLQGDENGEEDEVWSETEKLSLASSLPATGRTDLPFALPLPAHVQELTQHPGSVAFVWRLEIRNGPTARAVAAVFEVPVRHQPVV